MKASVRYEQIAFDHVPVGVTVVIRPDLDARAYLTLGVMHTPYPSTALALQVFLHECAHFHFHRTCSYPIHRQEYEAESWSFAVMRAYGVEVHERSIQCAQGYVSKKIRAAMMRGANVVDCDTFEFIDPALALLWGYERIDGLQPILKYGKRTAILGTVGATPNFANVLSKVDAYSLLHVTVIA